MLAPLSCSNGFEFLHSYHCIITLHFIFMKIWFLVEVISHSCHLSKWIQKETSTQMYKSFCEPLWPEISSKELWHRRDAPVTLAFICSNTWQCFVHETKCLKHYLVSWKVQRRLEFCKHIHHGLKLWHMTLVVCPTLFIFIPRTILCWSNIQF